MAFLLDRFFQGNPDVSGDFSRSSCSDSRVRKERMGAELHVRSLLDAFGKGLT
jgi:hypothetical protein